MFELGKEALDAPTLFVSDLVVCVLILAMASWWNDWNSALFKYDVVQTVSVIGTVGENFLGVQSRDEVTGRRHVVLLSGTEIEANRQTQRIDYGVDFGSEPAA